MTTPTTISAVRAYNACRRKYQIQYVLGYEPITKKEALSFGDKVHKALEFRWLFSMSCNVQSDGFKEYVPPTDASDVKARVMLVGYSIMWGDDCNRYRVLAVEKEFVVEVAGYKVAGKIDVLVQDLVSGLVYVVEHKTTSEDIGPASDYWRRLVLDDQVSMYSMAVKQLGYNFGGTLYDVLKKHGEEPRQATPLEQRKYKKDGTLYASQRADDESLEDFEARLTEKVIANPDAYYARRFVVRTDEQLAEFREELVDNIERMKADVKFSRNPGACYQYNSRCVWHDVCSGCSQLVDIFRYKKLEKVNQELEFDLGSV